MKRKQKQLPIQVKILLTCFILVESDVLLFFLAIEASLRSGLLEILTHILYAKLISRVGRTAKTSLSSRRNAVLSFLAGRRKKKMKMSH